MLPDDVIAVFLVLSLALSLGRSVYELKKSHGRKEVEPTASEQFLF